MSFVNVHPVLKSTFFNFTFLSLLALLIYGFSITLFSDLSFAYRDVMVTHFTYSIASFLSLSLLIRFFIKSSDFNWSNFVVQLSSWDFLVVFFSYLILRFIFPHFLISLCLTPFFVPFFGSFVQITYEYTPKVFKYFFVVFFHILGYAASFYWLVLTSSLSLPTLCLFTTSFVATSFTFFIYSILLSIFLPHHFNSWINFLFQVTTYGLPCVFIYSIVSYFYSPLIWLVRVENTFFYIFLITLLLYFRYISLYNKLLLFRIKEYLYQIWPWLLLFATIYYYVSGVWIGAGLFSKIIISGLFWFYTFCFLYAILLCMFIPTSFVMFLWIFCAISLDSFFEWYDRFFFKEIDEFSFLSLIQKLFPVFFCRLGLIKIFLYETVKLKLTPNQFFFLTTVLRFLFERIILAPYHSFRELRSQFFVYLLKDMKETLEPYSGNFGRVDDPGDYYLLKEESMEERIYRVFIEPYKILYEAWDYVLNEEERDREREALRQAREKEGIKEEPPFFVWIGPYDQDWWQVVDYLYDDRWRYKRSTVCFMIHGYLAFLIWLLIYWVEVVFSILLWIIAFLLYWDFFCWNILPGTYLDGVYTVSLHGLVVIYLFLYLIETPQRAYKGFFTPSRHLWDHWSALFFSIISWSFLDSSYPIDLVGVFLYYVLKYLILRWSIRDRVRLIDFCFDIYVDAYRWLHQAPSRFFLRLWRMLTVTFINFFETGFNYRKEVVRDWKDYWFFGSDSEALRERYYNQQRTSRQKKKPGCYFFTLRGLVLRKTPSWNDYPKQIKIIFRYKRYLVLSSVTVQRTKTFDKNFKKCKERLITENRRLFWHRWFLESLRWSLMRGFFSYNLRRYKHPYRVERYKLKFKVTSNRKLWRPKLGVKPEKSQNFFTVFISTILLIILDAATFCPITSILRSDKLYELWRRDMFYCFWVEVFLVWVVWFSYRYQLWSLLTRYYSIFVKIQFLLVCLYQLVGIYLPNLQFLQSLIQYFLFFIDFLLLLLFILNGGVKFWLKTLFKLDLTNYQCWQLLKSFFVLILLFSLWYVIIVTLT